MPVHVLAAFEFRSRKQRDDMRRDIDVHDRDLAHRIKSHPAPIRPAAVERIKHRAFERGRREKPFAAHMLQPLRASLFVEIGNAPGFVLTERLRHQRRWLHRKRLRR